MKRRWVFLILCLFITLVYAQNTTASPVPSNSSLSDNSTDGYVLVLITRLLGAHILSKLCV